MYSSKPNELRFANLMEEVSKFEEFRATILPALQKDIKSGMSAKEMREKYSAILQARLITAALATKDDGKATAMIRDILDRSEGRATEKKEVTHRFKDMKDEELDAMLKSEEQELQDMGDRFLEQ